jgi:hypothetical protein
MDISAPKISSRKLILQLTFSKASPKVISRVFFFLTTRRAIKSELWMQYRHGRCRKVRLSTFYFIFSDFNPTDTGPKKGWTHHPGGPRMRHGQLPNGDIQSFYFPDDHPSMPGWFKGMEQIIQERCLWPAEGLNAQCQNFHCPPGRTDCCCRRLLFSQPDFVNHRSQLQELIESRGHLCDFYPKYHCELNFIEQYWGAAKLRFRSMKRAATMQEMEKNVISSLDDIPLLQIRR